MNILVVILILLLLLAGILLIRIGAEVVYDQDGVSLWVKIAGGKLTILPKKPKTRSQLAKAEEKKQKKQKKKQAKAEKKKRKEEEKKRKAQKKHSNDEAAQEEASGKKGGTVELVLALLPILVRALGALKRRIRLDPLEVHYTAACADAADTALLYTKTGGAAGIISALLEENFDVRHRKVTVDMDFLSATSTVYIRAGISIRIGQVLYLAVRYGLACLKVYLQKRKSASKAKTQPVPAGEAATPKEVANDTNPDCIS